MNEIREDVVNNVLEADIIPFDPTGTATTQTATAAASGKSLAAMVFAELLKDALIFTAGFCIAKAHSIYKNNKQVRHKCGECDMCGMDEYDSDVESLTESETDE